MRRTISVGGEFLLPAAGFLGVYIRHIYRDMVSRSNKHTMFRAIGFVIALYAVTNVFNTTVVSFERALVATFETIETAAVVSKKQLESGL